MSYLWAIPPAAVALVVAVLVIGLRSVASVAGELRAQLEQLDEVRVAVAELRGERRAFEAALDRVRAANDPR